MRAVERGGDLQSLDMPFDPNAGRVRRATPCFTPGTLITTAKGECPVEDLAVDDRVVTRDNGIVAVRWVGKTLLYPHDLRSEPHLLPVLIRQGSFGKDLPERDMLVSPNHRILVASGRTALKYADGEALVAAKHLAGTGGHKVPAGGLTYVHFMCDRHEVVLADGVWTESFQPDDYSLKGIGNAQRLEIVELFPALKTTQGVAAYQAARPTIDVIS